MICTNGTRMDSELALKYQIIRFATNEAFMAITAHTMVIIELP